MKKQKKETDYFSFVLKVLIISFVIGSIIVFKSTNTPKEQQTQIASAGPRLLEVPIYLTETVLQWDSVNPKPIENVSIKVFKDNKLIATGLTNSLGFGRLDRTLTNGGRYLFIYEKSGFYTIIDARYISYNLKPEIEGKSIIGNVNINANWSIENLEYSSEPITLKKNCDLYMYVFEDELSISCKPNTFIDKPRIRIRVEHNQRIYYEDLIEPVDSDYFASKIADGRIERIHLSIKRNDMKTKYGVKNIFDNETKICVDEYTQLPNVVYDYGMSEICETIEELRIG